MVDQRLRYFLFPQTVLSEKDFRFFSYLFPELHLLQILRPPAVPEWGTRQFSGWPAITDHELLDAIRGTLEAFREFAALHGEGSGLASISHEYIAAEYSESRFQIGADLRKKHPATSEVPLEVPMEASLFLEMARDLDEREMEMETGIAQVDRLESEFREILGIASEEELEDVVETVTPPLVAESDISYGLPKRMAFWLRLLHYSKSVGGSPVLVVNSSEVIEEALESLSRWLSLQGKELHPERHVLCRVPVPLVQRLRNGPPVESAGPPLMARDGIVRLLPGRSETPADPLHQSHMDAAEKACAEWLSDLGVGSGGDASDDLELFLVNFRGATATDLWKSLDRDGHQRMQWTESGHPEPLMFAVVAGKQEGGRIASFTRAGVRAFST